MFFFPGYALMATLSPGKEEIGSIQRVVFSFGGSITVVPLIGLIVYYTPWGVRLESILYPMASFIFITSVIAWFKQKKLAEEERFRIKFHLIKARASSFGLAMAGAGGHPP